MEFIRQYLYSLITASLIVGIIRTLLRKKRPSNSVIQLISGIFLLFVMLSPLLKLNIQDASHFYTGIKLDGERAVDDGKNMAVDATVQIINERLEAYILDKATALHLNLDVTLMFKKAMPPSPASIVIKGEASPYSKQIFQTFLLDEIGIPKEKQLWQ